MDATNPYEGLDILVIANPVAGQPEPVLAPLGKVFGEHEIAWQVVVTREDLSAGELARGALEAGVPTIVSYGGDGTVNEIAGVLRNTEAVMGILPGGTANVFAAELGIPDDLEAAAEVVARRDRVMEIDLGEAYGEEREPKVFVLRLGAGVEADIATKASREDKDRLGIFAYVAQGLREVASLASVEWTVSTADTEEHVTGVTAAIANAGHMGFAQLEFDDKILTDDGVLDAVVLPGSNLGEAAVAATSLLGSDSERLLHVPGTDIHLDADPPQLVVLDGEEYGQTPVSARVLPHALKVIVPAA